MVIDEIIRLAKSHKMNVTREPISLSFGDRNYCERLFKELFMAADGSVKDFKMLPEYSAIVDWMVSNDGKGLCLWGDCGRGKSTIVTGVIPMLFLMRGKVVRPELAQSIPSKINALLDSQVVCIDEIGTEPMVNDFGEKYEGFNAIINVAEDRLKLLFITTNLTPEQILDRYGERTVERIKRLCKLVKFKGDSLRM
jgi:DNA replication protein DnaC